MAWSTCFSLPIRRAWISSLITICWNRLQNFKAKGEWEPKKAPSDAKLKHWKIKCNSTRRAFALLQTDLSPKCKQYLHLTKQLCTLSPRLMLFQRTRKRPLQIKANTSSTNCYLLNLEPQGSSKIWDQLTKIISFQEFILVTSIQMGIQIFWWRSNTIMEVPFHTFFWTRKCQKLTTVTVNPMSWSWRRKRLINAKPRTDTLTSMQPKMHIMMFSANIRMQDLLYSQTWLRIQCLIWL